MDTAPGPWQGNLFALMITRRRYSTKFAEKEPFMQSSASFHNHNTSLMLVITAFIAIILFLPGGIMADTVNSASETKTSLAAPSEIEARVADARKRRGDHYANLLHRFLEDTPRRQPGGIVFLGDSITEGFPTDQAFPGENVINRGIGGDRILGVKERLDVSVADLKPSRVYLMISINDLLGSPQTPLEEFSRQYAELLDALKAAAPQARIIVQSVLPLSGNFAPHNERVLRFNAMIRPLAEARGMEWLDLHPAMGDKSGLFRREYTSEGLHLTLAGYVAWLEVIMPREKFLDHVIALGPLWKKRHGTTFPVTAVNPTGDGPYPGGRGPDQMIIYTPACGRASTGTNPWGMEAEVRKGTVTRVEGNDNAIPSDGFIVSGHGDAATWISITMRPGTKVSYTETELRIQPAAVENLDPAERLAALRSRYFTVLADLSGRKAPEETMTRVRALYDDIRSIDPAIPESAETVTRVSKLLDAFEGK